jgi:hypothetical protein
VDNTKVTLLLFTSPVCRVLPRIAEVVAIFNQIWPHYKANFHNFVVKINTFQAEWWLFCGMADRPIHCCHWQNPAVVILWFSSCLVFGCQDEKILVSDEEIEAF